MLIELRDIEAYVEPDDILQQALRDGDLSGRDTINILQEDMLIDDILDEFDPIDILAFCKKNEIKQELDFEEIVDSLQELSKEEKKEIIWKIINIDNDITKSKITKSIELQIVIPTLEKYLQVKEADILWDHMDDYYHVVVQDIEINIRAYSESSFHLWMYDNKKDDEVIDTMFTSYDELKSTMNGLLHSSVTYPKIEDLLKITQGKKSE